MRCSVLQYVALAAVCCSVLQCVAVCCSVLQCAAKSIREFPPASSTCCSVLQCVAVCYCGLQCVAVCFCVLHILHKAFQIFYPQRARVARPWAHESDTTSQKSARCNTLRHTATNCNTLQHTAVHCNTHSDTNNVKKVRALLNLRLIYSSGENRTTMSRRDRVGDSAEPLRRKESHQ